MAICILRHSEAKNKRNFISEQVRQSQRAIKKHSVELEAFFIKCENETLQDVFKRYQENNDGFIIIFNSHYELILNQMKEFVKEYASKEIDFEESWPVFESDWWQPLEELTEDDFGFIK